MTRCLLVFAAVSAWLALAAGAAGCATVRPWERELLSHPQMADEPSPERAAFGAHVMGARESALSPSASGGGGCGCN